MNLAPFHELIAEWREEAEAFRRRGLDREAQMAESFAADLEDRLREWWAEELTLGEAAEESGVAYDTLRKRHGAGVGKKGCPRIRRCDLHSNGRTGASGGPSLVADLLAS